MPETHPKKCHRFPICTAPLCPLDTSQGSHVPGESVCLAMRELVKIGGQKAVEDAFGPEQATIFINTLADYREHSKDIARRLVRSANTPSKLKGLK